MIEDYKGQSPSIDKTAYIASKAVVIGKVRIGRDCSIWPMASVRGDVNYIEIGEYSNIQDCCVLHVTHDGIYSPGGQPLIIKDYVTVGHSVTLHACTIKSYSLIGIGSIVLDKAVVNERVLVGAGSLVPPGKVLDSEHLYLGSPVKKIRKLTKLELDFFEYSAKHYVKLKNDYIGS